MKELTLFNLAWQNLRRKPYRTVVLICGRTIYFGAYNQNIYAFWAARSFDKRGNL